MSNGDMNLGPMSNSAGSMNMNSMEMHTSFFTGKDVTILFSGWPENRTGMYVLALLFMMFLGFAIEVLSILTTIRAGGRTKPIIGALIQASVYAVRMCFAYMVMLSIMSYNLGIFIAAISGHAIGFFFVKFRDLAKETEQQYMSPNMNSSDKV